MLVMGHSLALAKNATTPTAVRVALLPQLHAQVMSSLPDELRVRALRVACC